MSFTRVKNRLQKLNPTKSDVDLQLFVRPHLLAGHKLQKLNPVELNILIGGRKMPLVIASDFLGLAQNLFGIALALSALAGLSLWPAARGHWSAVLMAFPAAAFAVRYLYLFRDPELWYLWIVFSVPLALAIWSIFFWRLRRSKVPIQSPVPTRGNRT